MGKRVAIIASSGGLETAYKVMNIALAATATDAEVGIFFTFDGLNIIHQEAEKILSFAPGNEHFESGFETANIPALSEMLDMVRESGAQLIACQMTMDVAGLKKEHFIEGVEVGGAVTFLDFAYDADVTLTF